MPRRRASGASRSCRSSTSSTASTASPRSGPGIARGRARLYTQERPEPCCRQGRRGHTARIFISYRREDDPGHAGRLYDQLAEHFGSEQVFMDVDALEPGVDFVERIESAVGTADALIVVIGRRWLDAADTEGRRRLEDPDDFVRIEVGSALRRGIRVIPVLVGGAVMPTAEQLPETLAPLARRNALVLSDLDWRSGMNRLEATLDGLLGHVEEPEEEEPLPTEEVDTAPTYYRRETPSREEEGGAAGAAGLLLTLLEVAGAALLVVGTALRVDEFAHPDFGGGNAPNLGFFTSMAPMGLAVGALGALALSHAPSARRLGVGLLLGFAAGGTATYVGLLGISARTEDAEASGPLVLALVGSGLLAAAAFRRAFAERGWTAEGPPATGASRSLVILGAALVVAGTLIPFNDGPAFAKAQVLIDRSGGWEALAPIACAAAAIVAAWLFTRSGTAAVGAGAIIGLGLLSGLLWLRYVGVPALQPDSISSPAAGGFVGLAGAGAILLGGLVAAARAARPRFAGRVSAGPAR